MKNSSIKFTLALLLILIIAGAFGGYFIINGRRDDDNNTSSTAASTSEKTPTAKPQSTEQITEESKITTEKRETTTKNKNNNNSSQPDNSYAYAYAGFNPVLADINQSKWNLLLVNRYYILPEDYSVKLSVAAPGSGYDTKLDARVAPHYAQMFNAAKEDGITLVPLSGSRRISTQKNNFENKITKYINMGYSRAQATRLAAETILPPGTSEHNAGLAMDICSLDVSFENTAEYKWLKEHAADYGFILRYPKDKKNITKINYEPWHWRYVGVEAAKAMKASSECLEEYLDILN